MRCYNPLYELFDTLNGVEDTNDLIAECERSEDPTQFAYSIASLAARGKFDVPEKKVTAAVAQSAALKFAAWWSYR
jgi:hypothetical protein